MRFFLQLEKLPRPPLWSAAPELHRAAVTPRAPAVTPATPQLIPCTQLPAPSPAPSLHGSLQLLPTNLLLRLANGSVCSSVLQCQPYSLHEPWEQRRQQPTPKVIPSSKCQNTFLRHFPFVIASITSPSLKLTESCFQENNQSRSCVLSWYTLKTKISDNF